MNHTHANETTFGFALWRWEQIPAMHIAHTHSDIELNWMPETRLDYLIAGKPVTLNAGELGVFWGGMPHQLLNTSPGGQGGIWLTLPLSWFLSRTFSHTLATRLMSGELVKTTLEPFRILQWEKDFANGSSGQRILLLELEATLERMAITSSPHHQESKSHPPEHATLIERVSSFLARHYQASLPIKAIAKTMDLHPNYLMSAFKQACGISIQTYILHLRLAHAQRLLSTTNLSILEVAMESGFGSLSQFYNHFSKHIGKRPLDYRRQQTLFKD